MKIIIYNHEILLIDINKEELNFWHRALSYVDKRKQFQLDKMKHSKWQKNYKAIEKLEKEVYGNLISEPSDIDESIVIEGRVISIPSGFADNVIEKYPIEMIKDLRYDTGKKTAMPFKSNNISIKLRDYQQEAIDIALEKHKGIINFATGLGKTLTAICLIKTIKRKTLIIVPNKNIANQFYGELLKLFPSNLIGFIGDGKVKYGLITVGIIGSVNNRVEELKKQDLGCIVIDECHHTPAATCFNIAKELGNVGRVYGLSATSFRQDGLSLLINAALGDNIIKKDINWGVKNGWLAEPFFYIRRVPTSGRDMKDKLGSYREHVLKSNIMKKTIENDARSIIDKGKVVLILVDQISHGQELSKNLNIPFVSGESPESYKYIGELNSGKIKAIVGTNCVGEGVDTKTVEVLILATFVASKIMVIQSVGRGLRKTESKDKCLIIDYIPEGSSILKRHALQRLQYYKEIAPGNIKVK